MRTLVIVHSYHHGNTGKVAQAIAEALGADIATPREVLPDALAAYDLVGFGSGIDSGHHYAPLLDLADRLPRAVGKIAFLFSTYGAPTSVGQPLLQENHAALRGKLESKGYSIRGEFSCPGHNTNSFLRFFGGLNKGRPNAADLRNAEEFARGLRDRAT